MNGMMIQQKNKISQLSQADFLKIEKAVLIDDLKDEYKKLRHATFFNLEKQLTSWMSNLVSHNTIRVYSNAIDLFLKYTNNNVLDVSVERADEYIHYLKKSFVANKTIKVYIGAVSSFYSHLTRYSYVPTNPFKGTKVPLKNEPMTNKVIPSEENIKSILAEAEQTFKEKVYKQIEISLRLMSVYGIRKGFLDNMELTGNKLVSFNKGKDYVVRLSEADTKYMNDNFTYWQNLKSNTVVTYINRIIAKLVKSEQIVRAFSVHCLRHKFAIDFYTQSKHDIYGLKLLLNHGSITTTENYLRELDIIK